MIAAIGAAVVVLALVVWALTGEDAGERARREAKEGRDGEGSA